MGFFFFFLVVGDLQVAICHKYIIFTYSLVYWWSICNWEPVVFSCENGLLVVTLNGVIKFR